MTDTGPSRLALEIGQTPHAVRQLLDQEGGRIRELGARLRRLDPRVVLTAARGSSDHAAGHFAYALEILSGVPVASVGPSVASVYEAPLRAAGAALIAVSQSGRSPDVVALVEQARRRRALTVAVVNDAGSPLAQAADAVLPVHAGREDAVAATKSFVASAVALSAVVAAWRSDTALRDAVENLPEALQRGLDRAEATPGARLSACGSLFVVGRGPSLPIAREAALKFKEVAGLHAEAFSAAEVLHGPLALAREGFPVVALCLGDRSDAAMSECLARFHAIGADITRVQCGEDAPDRIHVPATGHFVTDAIAMVLPVYRLVESVARARGLDPDRPAHISKITRTM